MERGGVSEYKTIKSMGRAAQSSSVCTSPPHVVSDESVGMVHLMNVPAMLPTLLSACVCVPAGLWRILIAFLTLPVFL